MKRFFSQILTAVILTLIMVATGWLFIFLYIEINNILLLAGVSILAFIVLYILVALLLQRFVSVKISPIYKTIYRIGDIRKEMKSHNLVDRVNHDVVNWATQKTEEISRLYEQERFRKEFLGNVAHELKSPIFNIQGYVLTLLDGGMNDPDINRKYLERTEKSVERLINITQELDIINRLETGEMQMNMTSFNLVALVEEIFDTFEMTAKNKQINLRTQWFPGGKIMVYADRKRISQVLVNLIGNSLNYGREGGETIVSFTDMPNRVLVEVSDTGIGISEEALSRIFERFYRVDKHRSREHGGSGLGLAIVKHIIEAHNQSINVHSTLGEGTTFSFTIDKSK